MFEHHQIAEQRPKNVPDETDKAVAVLAAGYRRTAAGIFLAGRAALVFLLAAAHTSEMADRFGEPFREVEHCSPLVVVECTMTRPALNLRKAVVTRWMLMEK